MPTRSITLKLVVPRRPDRLDAARALWSTHRAINEAVAYYEQWLLLMRGTSYRTAEGLIPTKDVVASLIKACRDAQLRNGATKGSDEEVVRLCRLLYEAIVPAAIGESGTAQAANAFLGPLTDRASRGFLGVFDKVERPLPHWVPGIEAGDLGAMTAANEWLVSDLAQPWLRNAGSPPQWLRLARKGHPSWPKAFAAKQKAVGKSAVTGIAPVIKNLKALGILPIFPPHLAPRIVDSAGFLNPWDRLAFRLAVAHLLSWESWCRRTAQEYTSRRTHIETFKMQHHIDEIPAIAVLRRYETEHNADLKCASPSTGDSQFRITKRIVRGWDDLRNRWQKLPQDPPDALLRVVTEEQTRKRSQFGDPHLFRWLAAHPEIWTDPTSDPVTLIARLNDMERQLEQLRDTAVMTLPDARLHPRSAQWEAEGGSNLRNYQIVRSPDGSLRATIPTLKRHDDGRYEEVSFDLAVAPSNQFGDPEFQRGGPVTVQFRDSADQRLTGTLGSADLVLNWNHLRARDEAAIAAGNIGPAYLKIALNLEYQIAAATDSAVPLSALHFQNASEQQRQMIGQIQPGLRVLAIDLGVRSFAACSVFELREASTSDEPSFHISDPGLHAVHERSFMLNMPGERQSKAGRKWRDAAAEELHQLRQTLARHNQLLLLKIAKVDERQIYLSEIRAALTKGRGSPFEEKLVSDLEHAVTLPPSLWNGAVEQVIDQFRTAFGTFVMEWRHRTRSGEKQGYMGKSLWALQHLTNIRRFLMSWSQVDRARSEIQRFDWQRGVFSAHLLNHINSIKEDRRKTGADLIVQAARGYQRDASGVWVKRYEPCHVILFEDLSRYRMLTDRPRQENCRLMKWTHRSLPDEVVMQAELYGFQDWRDRKKLQKYRDQPLTGICLDTAAPFSSRYRATTMTPGIRCHPLTIRDLVDPRFLDLLARESPTLDLSVLRPGDLVPFHSGEVFVSLSGTGVVRIHAGINAAQNLQQRFWTQYAKAFRLPARKVTVEGQDIWVPIRLGKRLLGALGGFGCLKPIGDKIRSCRWAPLKPAQYRRLVGQAPTDEDDGVDADPEFGSEAFDPNAERVVFFRDPSGEVLSADLWYPSTTFWSIVRAKTLRRLSQSLEEPVVL